jgi:hypothetical protein
MIIWDAFSSKVIAEPIKELVYETVYKPLAHLTRMSGWTLRD